MQFLRDLYYQIRPHLTVSRVVAFIAAPVGLIVGKLATLVASWGYALDPTQTTVIFLGGAAFVVAAVIKWLDGRAKYEVAQVHEGKDPGSPPAA